MGKMEDFIDKTRKVQSECGTLSRKKKKKVSFKEECHVINGNPLQYSCLENPRDGGASRAAVQGVGESRT